MKDGKEPIRYKARKSILGRGNSECKGPGVRKEEENGRKQSLRQVLNRRMPHICPTNPQTEHHKSQVPRTVA